MNANVQLTHKKNILFFDGVCNLCNGFIDFLIRRDKTQKIYFSPLQSEVASRMLGPQYIQELPSVVYFRNGKALSESTAVLYVLKDLGGAWSLCLVFIILPRSLRDMVYRFIAKSRYKWFGRRSTCRLPGPDEQTRFL